MLLLSVAGFLVSCASKTGFHDGLTVANGTSYFAGNQHTSAEVALAYASLGAVTECLKQEKFAVIVSADESSKTSQHIKMHQLYRGGPYQGSVVTRSRPSSEVSFDCVKGVVSIVGNPKFENSNDLILPKFRGAIEVMSVANPRVIKLLPGDSVVSVNGVSVRTTQELQTQLNELAGTSTAKLEIVRNSKRQEIEVTVDEDSEELIRQNFHIINSGCNVGGKRDNSVPICKIESEKFRSLVMKRLNDPNRANGVLDVLKTSDSRRLRAMYPPHTLTAPPPVQSYFGRRKN